MKSLNIKYIAGVDHLRAFAACLVVLFHGFEYFRSQAFFLNGSAHVKWVKAMNPLESFLIEGRTAVALFFVLSGFILTYGAMGTKITYKNFLINRILRIYPLFLFMLFVGFAFYPEKFSLTSLLQNILTFTDRRDLGPFSFTFWSIGVEFQFYLIFPFLLVIMMEQGVKRLLSLALVVILFRSFAIIFDSVDTFKLSYLTIIGRMDQFIFGMIAAKIFISVDKKYLRFIFPLSVFIVVILLFWFNSVGGWTQSGNWKVLWSTIEGVMWALFIISYLAFVENLSNKNIYNVILCKIGTLSFSIYIIHWTIMEALFKANFIHNFGGPLISNVFLNALLFLLPLTILVSFLTYYAIEEPFFKMRRKYIIPDPKITPFQKTKDSA